MRCPVCDDVTLVISSREGVEIDHCPQCRGVWLDRGELDKVIDRAAPAVAPAAAAGGDRYDDRARYDDRRPPRYDDRPPRYDDRPPRYDDRYDPRYDPRRRKKRSFLEDLFDFD